MFIAVIQKIRGFEGFLAALLTCLRVMGVQGFEDYTHELQDSHTRELRILKHVKLEFGMETTCLVFLSISDREKVLCSMRSCLFLFGIASPSKQFQF